MNKEKDDFFLHSNEVNHINREDYDKIELLVNAAKAFVARFEGAEKTVAASRNVSALLNFRTHPCMERACPFRLL